MAFFMDNPQQHGTQATANIVGPGKLAKLTVQVATVVKDK